MIWGVSIPHWDALSQYTFYGPWIERFQDCWWDPEFPQLSQMVQSLPGFLNLCAVQVKSSEMFTPRHLKLLSAHPLHRGPTDHLEGDLCPPEDMSAAVSVFTSGACSAAVVWQETERGQGVCWGSCVPAYGYCVIAGHIAPNDRWEGFCPVCHGRLALGADGERVELFLCVWVLFISLNGSHESRSLFSFLSILYFPLFFIGSLTCSSLCTHSWCRQTHTHTYTRAQSRLLVPVLSSQVLIGSGFSNVQMINGLRIWRRSPPPPPHPFLPSPCFSSFSPKPIYVWMQDHTHTHTATKCWWGSSQPLRVVLCHSGSCCIVSGGVGEGTCSPGGGIAAVCQGSGTLLQRASWQNVKLEEVSSSPQPYIHSPKTQKTQISHTRT